MIVEETVITIRECTIDDIIALQEISIRTYNDTFVNSTTAANMEAYLEKAFNHVALQKELSNSHSTIYFLLFDGKVAGYFKLNEYQAQTDIHDPKSMELERIYLLSEFQGKGLGQSLINKAIEVARLREKTYIWLGVWEKNSKAKKIW